MRLWHEVQHQQGSARAPKHGATSRWYYSQTDMSPRPSLAATASPVATRYAAIPASRAVTLDLSPRPGPWIVSG